MTESHPPLTFHLRQCTRAYHFENETSWASSFSSARRFSHLLQNPQRRRLKLDCFKQSSSQAVGSVLKVTVHEL